MSTYSLKDADYPQLNFQARPKHIRDQTRARLNQFEGGHFSSQNLSSILYAHRIDSDTHAQNVKLIYWSAPGRTKPTFEEAVRALAKDGKEAKKGMEFGPSWTNHWFKVTIHIPPEWAEYERVQFEFDGSGEAMIITTEGLPIHGLTGGFDVDRRVEFIIPPSGRKAGTYTFYVENSANGMFGINNMDPPDPNRYYRLKSADLVVPNIDAWKLLWDFKVLHQLVDVIPSDSPLSNKAMYVANEIMNTFETGSLESVRKARKVAEQVLGKDWENTLEKERESGKKRGQESTKDSNGNLWGVGHCHIDTAWLWPFSVTQQKIARSWSTQVDLMDRYPEHRFSCTQAQQYKWLEELYPLLFDKVQAKIVDGTFQPTGATWVEMDVNMPSGEALCRQFLYGQRYFESRFGFRCPTFVLPDTFGYSSQLPQIARLSGCKNFFTQKLSWNSINSFPHTTFNWVAIDGSQILTHMTPVNNYNSQCNMDDIRRGITGHKNLEVTQNASLLYGNGDGGGGSTAPMLEKLRRARAVALSEHCGGGDLPLVRMGGSMDEFFDVVREETAGGNKLPNWRGELYFELHRGTYTSHGSIKKGNRKNEYLLREVELAATMASLYGSSDYKYPKKQLDASWEDLLLCQFHDVLPGSGIAMIYEDAEFKYAAMKKSSLEILEEAFQQMYPGSSPVPGPKVGSQGRLIALNSVPSIARREIIPVYLPEIPGLLKWSTQVNAAGNGKAYILAESSLGDHEGSIVDDVGAIASPVTIQQLNADTFVMANATLSMKITEGRISSIYDHISERELLPKGETGGFIIYEDQPANWDAWDVEIYHLESYKRLKFSSVKIAENGPLRASLACETETAGCQVAVQISMDAIAASVKPNARSMIRFDAVIDWREKHKFLKFELPTNIHNDNATYDTQFGILSRPTHRNTSWDNAKFEVCAHKFVDLSEYGYGVALINDCKYGYAVEGNVMRLSLLRAPTLPDPDCDMGLHEFSFAIYPHEGTFSESDVHDVSYAFNNPMRLRFLPASNDKENSAYKSTPFTVLQAPNVFLETIKRAEDDVLPFGGNSEGKTMNMDRKEGNTQTVILRLFERMGGHAKSVLKISGGLSVIKASITNILEDEISELSLRKASEIKSLRFQQQGDHYLTGQENGEHENAERFLELHFRGFEIKTVKLELRRK